MFSPFAGFKGGRGVGTVPQGFAVAREFYDITEGDRVLTVDFVKEGDRLTVLLQRGPMSLYVAFSIAK